MTVKINYSNKKIGSANAGNLILFVNDKFSTNNLKSFISKDSLSYINDILKTSDLKKNLLVFEISSKKK